MAKGRANKFIVAREFQDFPRQLGLGAEELFEDPRVVVWRKLPDRENCTFEETLPDGEKVKLHIKRYAATRGSCPAEIEANGVAALVREGIETVPFVGWGTLADGRSFTISQDLRGFTAGDRWIDHGGSFERLLEPTARLAARLHERGLHHRDLYLCHFFVRDSENAFDVRLIDAARVKRLPAYFFRRRWIVKDLSQFWYSAMRLSIPVLSRRCWLECYVKSGPARAPATDIDKLQRAVEAKARWIEKHDAKLRAAQPGRNVSIPK